MFLAFVAIVAVRVADGYSLVSSTNTNTSTSTSTSTSTRVPEQIGNLVYRGIDILYSLPCIICNIRRARETELVVARVDSLSNTLSLQNTCQFTWYLYGVLNVQ
jgi:hypothetical protein